MRKILILLLFVSGICYGQTTIRANQVKNTPAGTISSTNQQAVNNELDGDNTTLSGTVTTLDAQNVKITGNQTIGGTKTFSSSPSAPVNTSSERFGSSTSLSTFTESSAFGNTATVGNRASVVFGYQATSVANEYDFQPGSFGGAPVILGTQATGQGISLGYKASTGDRENMALGQQAIAEGTGSGVGAPALIAIGDGAHAVPTGANGNQIVMGDASYAKGNINYFIGGGGGIEHDFVACLGCQGSSTAYTFNMSTRDHQMFFGAYQPASSYFSGGAGLYNEYHFGPEFATFPHDIDIFFNGTSGTNINGVTTKFKASRGTGTGNPGVFTFQTSNTGSSGATVQTLVDRITINGGIGDLLIKTGSIKTQSASNAGTAVNTLSADVSTYGANSTTGSGFFGYNTYIDDAGSFQRDNTGASAAGLYITNASSEFLSTFQFVTSGGTATYPFTVQGAGNAHLMAATQLGWTSSTTSSRGAIDTGLLRDGVADVRVTSGPTLNGNGSIRSDEKIVAKTGNYTILFTDTESFFTNTGAAGTVNFTLPTAAAGRTYTFYIDASQTLTITAGASTTIRIAGTASAAAGNITSNTVGNCITLVAISATQWVAKNHEGTWTIN